VLLWSWWWCEMSASELRPLGQEDRWRRKRLAWGIRFFAVESLQGPTDAKMPFKYYSTQNTISSKLPSVRSADRHQPNTVFGFRY